jgi:hypothetical protein
MWSLLSFCLSWLVKNPVVQAIAMNTLKNIVQHGTDLVPLCIAEIRVAATRDDLSGINKLGLVVDKVTEQFPAIGKDIVIGVAQSTYLALKSPNVPEIV